MDAVYVNKCGDRRKSSFNVNCQSACTFVCCICPTISKKKMPQRKRRITHISRAFLHILLPIWVQMPERKKATSSSYTEGIPSYSGQTGCVIPLAFSVRLRFPPDCTENTFTNGCIRDILIRRMNSSNTPIFLGIQDPQSVAESETHSKGGETHFIHWSGITSWAPSEYCSLLWASLWGQCYSLLLPVVLKLWLIVVDCICTLLVMEHGSSPFSQLYSKQTLSMGFLDIDLYPI